MVRRSVLNLLRAILYFAKMPLITYFTVKTSFNRADSIGSTMNLLTSAHTHTQPFSNCIEYNDFDQILIR